MKSPLMAKVVVGIGVMLGLATWASARTVYVSQAAAPTGANGSLEHPYPTIMGALAHMSAGDTCLVRAGTYREQLNLDQPGITLAAYENEVVMVSGCDVVNMTEAQAYTIPASGVECTRVKLASPVYQMFAAGRRMDLARWPDKTKSMLSMQDWEDSVVDAKGAQKDKTATFATLADQPQDYWKGGYYVGVNDDKYPGHALSTWFSATARIASSTGRVLHLGEVSYGVGSPQANGKGYGYIVNCLGALDAAGEWYWGDGYLYFKTPAGAAPGATVEARTRMYVLNILANDIQITGLNFVAGNVLIKGNQAKIEKCTFRYLSPFVFNPRSSDDADSGARGNWGDYRTGSNGIAVLGNGMTMKDCYLAHSWFSCMVIWGDQALVENCLVEDADWMSKRCAGINSFGADNVIRFCTIRNLGSSCIEGGNGNWLKKYAIRNLWEHNLLQNIGLLAADSNGGYMYVNHQDGSYPPADSEWRYNFCIHSRGPDKGQWGDAPALYVDNNSSGYKIHHNVVVDGKLGMRYNDFLDGEKAGKGVYFYNNTFYKVDRGMGFAIRADTKPDADVTVENNLGFDCVAYGNFMKLRDYGPPNVIDAKDADVRDATNLDFELVNPKYIDAGKIIPGIKMEYVGQAPDIGAYESGQPRWTYGATLKTPPAFAHDELPAPGAVAE